MSQSVLQDGKIFVGKSVKPEYLDLRLANRHGLITGATGTGKTVTLQVLAEGFSRAGVPVFAADIKGDLSGIAAVGEPKDFLVKRAAEVGLDRLQEQRASPSCSGTCSASGATRSAPPSTTWGRCCCRACSSSTRCRRACSTSPSASPPTRRCRSSISSDLRAIINNVAERAKELTTKYGNVATTSVGAIQRRLLVLEEQGADHFFGEPALDIKDFMRTRRTAAASSTSSRPTS